MSDEDKIARAIKQIITNATVDSGSGVMKAVAVIAAADIGGGAELAGHALASTLIGEGVGATLGALVGLAKSPVPNPWFIVNGQDDRPSPVSAGYKKSRKYKIIGGALASAVGTVASASTVGINVASSVKHANATGSTLIHLQKIRSIAAAYRQSRTISDWCDLLIDVKMLKAAIRGGELALGFIPGASIPTTIAATVAKAGVKLTYGAVVYNTAAAIHWRAFQEQAISHGAGGGVGPASRIYWEIFTRRGLTRLLGQYDIAQLVKEPCGWEALTDKLLLM